MSRPAGYRPVVWLRRLLLVALVAFLGVVAGLLIKGRSAGVDPEVARGARELAAGEGEEVRTGKGFSHEVTEEGEPRYRIAASSWSSTRDEMVRLNEVAVRFDRGAGEEYTIEAEKGVYQRSTSTATLLGNVRIVNADGFEIGGPGFELRRRGSLIVSTGGPVRFRYQDRFAGQAGEVSSNLRRKRHELAGGVRIWSLGGEAIDASLDARRLVFEQREGTIHAEGGVALSRDGEELAARRLSIELDDAGKRPRFVRARWEVSGSRPQLDEGVPQTLRFAADQVSVLFDPSGDPLTAELEGRDRAPARLEIAAAGGEVRRIETAYLVAGFAGGAIATAEAPGEIALTDFLAFDPGNLLVTGCAESAEARFRRGGEMESIVLDGGVEFNQPTAQVSGDVVEARGDEQIVVSGRPARVHATRGDFEAPEILYRPGPGTGSASGGVRATLAANSGVGLMKDGAAARGPIQVTAAAAEWSDGGGSVTFRDRVRAWQDENYLSAERLEVGTGSGSLKASGRVKTVIKRAAGEAAAGEETDSPIEVTAAELDFDGARDLLRYTGSPKARQAGRTLSCLELEVELDDGSEIERMLCAGNAVIESPADGQTVRGERALYLPASDRVEVSGNPVVLRQQDGRQVTGARVLYDFRTGAARVLTSAVEPAPAASTAEVDDDGGGPGG